MDSFNVDQLSPLNDWDVVACPQISGNAIYVEVIEDEYAARVTNLHMYDAIR